MPAILAREERGTALSGPIVAARSLLKAYPPEFMVAYPVAKRVNSARNNDAGLIEPLNP